MEAVIVDNGGANLASLQYALERLGARSCLSRNPRAITAAARIILPGVGTASSAMQRLEAAGLCDVLASLKQPVLGICLGMQLLYRESEEGPTPGLGVFGDVVRRLQGAPGHPVPHMGWNRLELRCADPLLDGIAVNEYMYFVHTYAAGVSEFTLASAHYGVQLAAVVRCRNFWGVQFHPERSGKPGSRLLANFLSIERAADSGH